MKKNPFDHVQSGQYVINGKSRYFRSRWEANYALYLQYLQDKKQIKGWEYEAETFMFEKIKLGTRSYKPDFRVTRNDDTFEYHEVKGYMDSRSHTKLKRMAKYYPHVKIILIMREEYRALQKWSKLLKFY